MQNQYKIVLIFFGAMLLVGLKTKSLLIKRRNNIFYLIVIYNGHSFFLLKFVLEYKEAHLEFFTIKIL